MLRRDVRMLGEMLGEVIVTVAGPEKLALIEEIRKLSRSRRDGDVADLRRLQRATPWGWRTSVAGVGDRRIRHTAVSWPINVDRTYQDQPTRTPSRKGSQSGATVVWRLHVTLNAAARFGG